MRPNILITSASAKVLLVRAFRAAATPLGRKVLTCDIQAICAAGLAADQHIQTGPIDAPKAREDFLVLIREHNIGLIVPTRDGELPFLAALAPLLRAEGTQVLVPDADALAICQDKRRFSRAVEAAGFAAIPIVDPLDPATDWPLFMRPITGAAGRGTGRVPTAQALPPHDTLVDILFHPLIEAPEYSIDLLMGVEPGQALQCVVRERQLVVGGEAKISQVRKHAELERQTLALGRALGLVGHNVVQAFDDPVRGLLFIEVNPRFGGASNLSIQSGLDSPARLLQILEGQIEAASALRPIDIGATLYRYSDDTIIAGTVT